VAETPSLPLLPSRDADAPIAWQGGQPVSRAALQSAVARVAACLPDRAYAINACESRYLFLVAFAAIGLGRQTNLLPTTGATAAIREITTRFPDHHVVDDARVRTWLDRSGDAATDATDMQLAEDHAIAIAFTSGSTGRAQPHLKTWGELVAGARLAERRFGFALAAGTSIVATVPPQHMYGLETSILLPLTLPVALHDGRPLLPSDVLAALAAVPAPRVLVTTPAHLRVLAETAANWPPLTLVISATAPLSSSLAQAAERVLAAPVMEIYGCTEAGSIASRRTLDGEPWTPYDGFVFTDAWVRANHLREPVHLNDVVELCTDGRFVLRGRQQDLINIAGKRTSLAYLDRVLSELDGVDDGAFVMPPEVGDRPVRLVAFVVAPNLTKKEILTALAQRIDPIFLPRPLRLVDRLPRNDFGKLNRNALLDLLRRGARRTIDGGG
jgi:Acyl-coenzyme A synthetases/AMP-(fatty) acid ligases